MRTRICFVFAAVFCLTGISAMAQRDILYQYFNYANGYSLNPNSTNQIISAAGVTNYYGLPVYSIGTNLVQDVGMFDNLGFTTQITPTPGLTNGLVGVYVYRSYDEGLIWETNPGFIFTNQFTYAQALAGTPWTVATNLNTPGVTRIAFVIFNDCTNPVAGVATNFDLSIKLKQVKQYSRFAPD